MALPRKHKIAVVMLLLLGAAAAAGIALGIAAAVGGVDRQPSPTYTTSFDSDDEAMGPTRQALTEVAGTFDAIEGLSGVEVAQKTTVDCISDSEGIMRQGAVRRWIPRPDARAASIQTEIVRQLERIGWRRGPRAGDTAYLHLATKSDWTVVASLRHEASEFVLAAFIVGIDPCPPAISD